MPIPSTVPFYPEPQTQNETNYPLPADTSDPTFSPTSPSDPGSPGGDTPLISTDQSEGDWYSDASVDGRYDWDMGMLQVPVAGPVGTPCEVIAVHAPTCARIVEWTASRVGSKPKAPASATNNANDVLAKKTVFPCSPAMGPDGTLIYRLSGRYVYFELAAPADTDTLFAGIAPYMIGGPSATNITSDAFDVTLSDASSTVPAAFPPPGLI